MRRWLIVGCWLVLANALPAGAKLYECPDGRGGIYMQDAPCHILRPNNQPLPPKLPPSRPAVPSESVPKSGPAPAASAGNTGESLEYQLATINAEGFISKDHITVARFGSLLDQLTTTYVENRQQIANMSVGAQKELGKNGIKESLLNIMEAMNQIFFAPFPNQKYAEYSAAYMVLRIKGQSHTEAIKGLQALMRTFGIR